MTQKEDTPKAGANDYKFTLRLTEELQDAIHKTSAREGRSINTEILLRLARTVEQDKEGQDQAMRTHLGLIEFLLSCIEDLSLLLSDEQRQDSKVQLMLELTRSLSKPRGEQK